MLFVKNKDKFVFLLQEDPETALLYMENLVKSPLYPYIDKIGFLESINPNLEDSIQNGVRCFVLPSETEIIANLGCNYTQQELEKYKEEHKQKGILLQENTSVFGKSYSTVYIFSFRNIIQTPSENVVCVKA
jgi:hypothetical protein